MIRRALPLSAFGLALLLGCGTTVRITSIPVRAGSLRLDRVFIDLATGPSGSGELMASLKDDLVGRLSREGVPTVGWVRDYLDVREDAKVQAAMDQHRPQSLLRVRQISSTTTNGREMGIALELSLIDLSTHETVWKARLVSEGNFGVQAGPVSDKILLALKEDGLLPPSASTAH